MSQTLETLTRRSATMGSIRSIVRTMKTMSAINALPYEQAAEAMQAYRATVLEGLHGFVQANGPLPQDHDPRAAPILIAFGSDHGLCGNYNEVVAEAVAQALGTTRAAGLICVGAQMEDALIGQGLGPRRALLTPATADGLGRLSGRLITALDGLRRDAAEAPVSLVHMQRGDHGLQQPRIQALLPLDRALTDRLAATPWTSRSLPTFRGPPGAMLAALIRSYLFAQIYAAAAEAMVTENAARLARMQQAERAVDEQLEGLTGELRQVRQSQITTELLDVIIGFEALTARNRKKAATPPEGQQ